MLVLLAKVLWPHAASAPEEAANDKSIAVLPFESLSRDPDNAYFADGIQDEILTRLAKIGSLKVISRTSTQQYAAKPGNLKEIGRQLGVTNILEGSVQKIGDAVHINVQLIRVAGGDHLGAETYDRKLDNVFGVEGEVAGAIAQQLQAKLSGAEQQALAQKPTENAAAYDAYLRGVAESGAGYSFDRQTQVADEFAEAVRLDPDFALAWARLATVRGFLYFNGVHLQLNSADAVQEAADTAMRLQPEAGESLLARGYYRYRVLRDYPAAQQDFAAALSSLPSDAEVLLAIGLVERRQGLWEQALAHLEASAQLDPRNVSTMMTIGGELLLCLNRLDESPDYSSSGCWRCRPRSPLPFSGWSAVIRARAGLARPWQCCKACLRRTTTPLSPWRATSSKCWNGTTTRSSRGWRCSWRVRPISSMDSAPSSNSSLLPLRRHRVRTPRHASAPRALPPRSGPGPSTSTRPICPQSWLWPTSLPDGRRTPCARRAAPSNCIA